VFFLSRKQYRMVFLFGIAEVSYEMKFVFRFGGAVRTRGRAVIVSRSSHRLWLERIGNPYAALSQRRSLDAAYLDRETSFFLNTAHAQQSRHDLFQDHLSCRLCLVSIGLEWIFDQACVIFPRILRSYGVALIFLCIYFFARGRGNCSETD
jgi:hypothetical protein